MLQWLPSSFNGGFKSLRWLCHGSGIVDWRHEKDSLYMCVEVRKRVAMDDSRSRERKEKSRREGWGDGRGTVVQERGFNYWMENLDEPRMKGREILTSP